MFRCAVRMIVRQTNYKYGAFIPTGLQENLPCTSGDHGGDGAAMQFARSARMSILTNNTTITITDILFAARVVT